MANNPKKYTSDSTLSALVTKIKELFVKKTDLNTELAKKADSSHTHTIGNVTNLQTTLDGKVPTTRTINNKPLSANITLSASDVGAASSSHDHNDVYYTETEIDSKLANKSDKTHNHDSDYADINHNHDGVYAVEGHNHDAKYDGKGAASSAVSSHNTSTSAHNDIRLLIEGLTTKLNNFLDVDDTTTDQLSELIALIENNADDIESITSGKVNVSDIINNLTTNVANKPLSAAQGVAIKALIDTLDSALDTHDANTTKHITSTERTNWNTAKTHADSAHAPSDAQKNQNAFSNIAVSGQSTVAADTATDTVTFVGDNVNITTDATNDKVTFSIPYAEVGTSGVVKISNSYSSDYETGDDAMASTTYAVKQAYSKAKSAYDLADTKQDKLTGAASTIGSSNLTADRALVSNSSGKVAASTITGTELGYLDGVTSNIQEQLDDKAAYSHNHSAAHITSGVMSASVLPDASDTKEGIVTTETQSFAGNKTFTGKITAAGVTSNGNINAGDANTYDIGSSLKPFKKVYTQNLYVDPKVVSGSVLDGGSFVKETDGTTTTKGLTRLTVGNYIKKGNAGNAEGRITIYNENNGSATLRTSHTDSTTPTIFLPDHMGTLVTEDDVAGLASVATVTQAEYTALEQAQKTNANTLYMITDAEEEVIPQIQIITWEEND